MKKIVPIITLCFSLLVLALAVAGITTVAIATSVTQIKIVAVPIVIFGAVFSLISTAFVYILRADKLCRIAFFISAAALVLEIIAIFIWLCLL